MSQFKGRPSESVCFNHRTGRSPCPCSVNWYQAEVVLHDPKYAQKGVRTYVDLTTYLGPNPQVYRKVSIINPVHRSRASQHPWLPERSTKLAVGASGGVLPPHSHYKRGQYSRVLRPVVAYGDGYSSPPIPGECVYLQMETNPLRNNFTAKTRGSF
jgi:hypothetical protein